MKRSQPVQPQPTATRPDPYGEFLDLLAAALAAGDGEAALGVVLIRVEDFERIVTSKGYREAGRLMAALEGSVCAGLRQKDRLVRLGEDRFAAIVTDVRNEGHLGLAAAKILRVAQAASNVTLRMGMALSPAHAREADQLLRVAKVALLSAAEDGEAYRLYDPQAERDVSDRWILELELDDALENNGLSVHYQPKVAARDGRVVGAEALLRWRSPTRGPVSPEVFVAIADETGRIDRLTWYVLNIATRECLAWAHGGEPLSIAVNVTAKVVEQADLPRLAANALGLWNLPPGRLVVELTESALMHNPARCTAVLTELREQGVKVAIDDFGTGYSSLSYFRNIPADELKIDKSFVLNMLDDAADRKIVRTVIALAHDFGLRVTAEGVENEATAALLAELGCDHLQGYYFSRPVPSADLGAWLGDRSG